MGILEAKAEDWREATESAAERLGVKKEDRNMMKRMIWTAGTFAALAIGIIALTGAQTNVAQDATIQDLLNLLLTEDGESRLDIIEAMLADIDREVDLIYSVAGQMLEEQYGFFETEEWTLSDIKFQLNQIETQLDQIEGCSCP